jgi:hypothetical protein
VVAAGRRRAAKLSIPAERTRSQPEITTAAKRNFGLDIFSEGVPTSWYPVAHSHTLGRGDVIEARIGDLELVVFRTEGGAVHAYPVRERFGTVFVYNEATEPALDFPECPEFDDPAFGATYSTIEIPVHQLAFHENGVDHIHLRYVHDVQSEHIEGRILEESPTGFSYEFTMRGQALVRFGPFALRGHSRTLSHYVAPNMNIGQLEIRGMLVARWVLSTQPLGTDETIVYASWSFRKLPDVVGLLNPALVRTAGWIFDRAVIDDIGLSWEGMRPDKRKTWIKQDVGMRTLHKFYRSFLPSERARAAAAPEEASATSAAPG